MARTRTDRFSKPAAEPADDDSRKLQRQLRFMLEQARQNELKLHRIQSLELRLLGAETLPDLIDMLLNSYPAEFDLDSVSVLLVDPEYEIRRVLEEQYEQLPSGLIFDTESTHKHHNDELFPMLGAYHGNRHETFFRGCAGLSSVAILPLLRQGRYLGSLNLGSKVAGRFIDGFGTDLLERLAAIVAVCIENTLNAERLMRTGLTDALTEVNNRRFFNQRILEEVERAGRKDETLSCLFIDIDHFKQVNDRYGHQTGDEALRQTAQLLQAHTRRSDVLARYGGEEFSVLLCNTPLDEAMRIAQRMRSAVEDMLITTAEIKHLQLTVSIGIAVLAPDDFTGSTEQLARQLVAAADHALFRAKDEGRNRVCIAP